MTNQPNDGGPAFPTEIMRITLDGGFIVNESVPATDAATEVLRVMKDQWFADAQATRIRELEDRVNRLEEALNLALDDGWNGPLSEFTREVCYKAKNDNL